MSLLRTTDVYAGFMLDELTIWLLFAMIAPIIHSSLIYFQILPTFPGFKPQVSVPA
jgi:hypothetical protein